MSFLQFTDAMNTSELQVWNNAAFDNDEVHMKASWSSSLDPVLENSSSESTNSDHGKENLSPTTLNSSVSVKSSVAIKPLQSIGNSQRRTSKVFAKKMRNTSEEGRERKIDDEIEEIENEIKRLSSRLEALRLEKAEQIAKLTVEKRGRVVAAKFMEGKQSVKKMEEKTPVKVNRRGMSLGPSEIFTETKLRRPGNAETTPFKATQNVKTIDETPLSVKSKFNRRGMSLGPSEIFTESKLRRPGNAKTTPFPATQNVKKIEEKTPLKFNRRGMSLGPSEIFGTARFRPPGKVEVSQVTPGTAAKKSCFLNDKEIEESKLVMTERRNRNVSRIETQKQAMSTVAGGKKIVKRESLLIQPRKLFKDSEKEKSVSTKKPLKPGRVIASRYNMVSSNQSFGTAIESARKRSLPENEKEEGGKKARGSEGIVLEGGRMKKRWEIPPEVVLYKRKEGEKEDEEEEEMENEGEKSLMRTCLLPKIKTTRFVDESPRGSGPAKRVAELKGKKKSYFCPYNEDVEEGVDVGSAACGALNFAEDECDHNDEAEDET